MEPMKSIFYEPPGPSLFNRWSVAHLSVGAIAKRNGVPFLPALLAHTFYEYHEDKVFTRETRDKSMLNHIGDTIAFVAGYAVK